MIHVSHSLKWSMPQKTKLHDIFRLHASRFLKASTERAKKYDFRFFKRRRFQFFSWTLISASSGASIHEILTPRSIAERILSMPEWLILTASASMLVAWSFRLNEFSGFWMRDLEKYAHHGSKQNIQHQKEKWCEALSLKSDRPYYVDFPVFDWSGKVSKWCNFEKFLKKISMMHTLSWSERCIEK